MPVAQDKTTQYNLDTINATLRAVLAQHGVASTTEILRDFERQITQAWDKQGVDPARYNKLFREEGQQKAMSTSER